MKKLSSIFFIILVLSCKTSKPIRNKNSKDISVWKVEKMDNYKEKNKVLLKIINVSDKNLVIYDPLEKNIEKFNGNSWDRVIVPYCPCGNCPPPPENSLIAPNEEYFFSWDKKTSSCRNNILNINTLKEGKYRVNINYSENKNTKSLEKITIEFSL